MSTTFSAILSRKVRRTDGSFDSFHTETSPVRVDLSSRYRVGMLPYGVPLEKVQPTQFEVRVAGRWRKVKQVRLDGDRYPTLFVGRKWDGELVVKIAETNADGQIIWVY